STVNDPANAATVVSRSAIRCSTFKTICSMGLNTFCRVDGSAARTAEPPAVAERTSKAKPNTLQLPATREFHMLFMFHSTVLQGRDAGEDNGSMSARVLPPIDQCSKNVVGMQLPEVPELYLMSPTRNFTLSGSPTLCRHGEAGRLRIGCDTQQI